MAERAGHWAAVTVDCADPAGVAAFWAAVLGMEPVHDALPGWARLRARNGDTPALTFQPVPEPKRGKARLHLDVTVDDIDAAIAVVLELGGRMLGQRYDYDEGVVVVMADPEGNEFCLVRYA